MSNHAQLDQLRYVSRPYIFTASPTPATIRINPGQHCKLLHDGIELRQQLWKNVHQLYSRLDDLGYQLFTESSPVIAIILDAPRQALMLWKGLLDHGIYVNLVLSTSHTWTAAHWCAAAFSAGLHTSEQMDHVGSAFAELREIVFSSRL